MREGGLHRPVAAELTARREGGVDQAAGDLEPLGPIHHAEPFDPCTHHRDAAVIVGAVLDVDRTLDGAQVPGFIRVDAQPRLEGVARLGGLEFLLAAEPYADRPLRGARQRCCDRLVLADLGLGAEAAANADLVTNDLLRLQPHHMCNFVRDVVGGLGRGPEIEPLFALIPAGDGDVGLHAGMNLARKEKLSGNRDLAVVASSLDRAPAAFHFMREVAAIGRAIVQLRYAFAQCSRHGLRPGQGLIHDLDGLQSSLRFQPGVSSDRGDLLADKAHVCLRHRRPITGALVQVTRISRKIGRRNHRANTGHSACLADIDARDLCMRIRRAKDQAFQQSFELEIAGVEERAGGARVPIDDAATLADVLHAGPVPKTRCRVASATERIASMMPV